jgi:hypothetical protein
LEIRLAYAVSASLATPANPDQPPIPLKGSVTHMSVYFAEERKVRVAIDPFLWDTDKNPHY